MENRDFAIAVNKFLFYQWNFESVPITYPSVSGGYKTEYMPGFFKVFRDNGLIEHMYLKWVNYHRRDTHSSIARLYGELSKEDRYIVLKWINENYSLREDFGITLED